MVNVRNGLPVITGANRPGTAAFIDKTRVNKVVEAMVQADVYLNPTLRIWLRGHPTLRDLGFHHEEFDLLMGDWRLGYVPLAYRMSAFVQYQQVGVWHWSDLTEYEQTLFDHANRNAAHITKAFVDAGGKLYTGSDASAACTPGICLHQELQLLVHAGVSELAALQSATINPAELLHEERLGKVSESAVADIQILNANSLEDIRDTRNIWRVISRGSVLDGDYDPAFANPVPRTGFLSDSYFFPSPVISEVSITADKLAVLGSGFTPYSLVRFNDEKLKVSWTSGRQISVIIPDARPGSYTVRVENPDLGLGDLHFSNESSVVVK